MSEEFPVAAITPGGEGQLEREASSASRAGGLLECFHFKRMKYSLELSPGILQSILPVFA